jgi:hypothetical protein
MCIVPVIAPECAGAFIAGVCNRWEQVHLFKNLDVLPLLAIHSAVPILMSVRVSFHIYLWILSFVRGHLESRCQPVKIATPLPYKLRSSYDCQPSLSSSGWSTRSTRAFLPFHSLLFCNLILFLFHHAFPFLSHAVTLSVYRSICSCCSDSLFPLLWTTPW